MRDWSSSATPPAPSWVEGYGLRALATAEVPVQLEFRADRAGEFAVLLENSDLELTRLRVA